jgi:hypothetical protein
MAEAKAVQKVGRRYKQFTAELRFDKIIGI